MTGPIVWGALLVLNAIAFAAMARRRGASLALSLGVALLLGPLVWLAARSGQAPWQRRLPALTTGQALCVVALGVGLALALGSVVPAAANPVLWGSILFAAACPRPPRARPEGSVSRFTRGLDDRALGTRDT